jgi:acyl-CoA hydrolase
VSVDEAIDAIPDGATVFVQSGCAMPQHLMQALAERSDRFQRLTLITGFLVERPAVADVADGPFEFLCLHPSRLLADHLAAGTARVVPVRYSDYAGMFDPDGPIDLDVAIVQVSGVDTGGRCSLGVSVGGAIGAVRNARLVIAQVNEAMPYTYGDGELGIDELDLLVPGDEPLLELPPAEITPEVAAIAAFVADLVPDGATLQLGVGAIPDAVTNALRSRRDLGLHGGLVTDGCRRLAEAGALTNAEKAFDQGVSVTAEAMGTHALYQWLHRNPTVRFVEAGTSHGIATLQRCHRLVAINSAIEVALDGTVNAEAIGGRIVSGPGGQPDFAAAAAAAPGGRSIIAFPSTSGDGRHSRIVPRLEPGTPATVPRYLADTIVTEHGVASLRWLDLAERAAALTAIAAPDFRAGLQHARA